MTHIVTVHAVATIMMTGLIWFVQVVHYPLFALWAEQGFARFAREHARRTTWVVAPIMLVEAATAVVLFLSPPTAQSTWLARTGLVLLAIIWLSTALLQVPSHRRLAAGFDAAVIRRLVASNWLRTAAWSGRTVTATALWLAAASARNI